MTEEEWLACAEPEPMLEFVKAAATDRKLRLFGVACCRRIWSLMPNRKCKAAVDRAESYAEGCCASHPLQEASENVSVGMLALRSEAAEYAATAAAWVASRDNLERTAEAAAASHGVAISLDDWTAEKRLEQVQQAIIFRDIFGNPFRPVMFNVTWRTSDALLLAQGIYEERAFDRLPILADALQDAGCASEDLLGHLRDPHATHARGCWALDLVLGKE